MINPTDTTDDVVECIITIHWQERNIINSSSLRSDS